MDRREFQKLFAQADSYWFIGLVDFFKAVVVNEWISHYERPLLFITSNDRILDLRYTDLVSIGGLKVLSFSERDDTLPEEGYSYLHTAGERIRALTAMYSGKFDVIVTTVGAVLQSVPQPEIFMKERKEIWVGEEMDRDELLMWLVDHGYNRSDYVEIKGEFSHRGGIVDVFPPDLEWPLRIEFVGNCIESIRYFDPKSQCSIKKVEAWGGDSTIILYPVNIESVGGRNKMGGIELYLPGEVGVALDEPIELERREEEMDRMGASKRCSLGEWICSQKRSILGLSELEQHSVLIEGLSKYRFDVKGTGYIAKTKNGLREAEQVRSGLIKELKECIGEGYEVVVWCNNEAEKGRLIEWLKENKTGLEGKVKFRLGSISGGFVYPNGRVVYISDDEIFARYKIKLPRRIKETVGVPIREIKEIKVGDYVVHIDHGIGKYLGLKTMDINGEHREMMVIEYANKAKLYVPVEEAHLVERYIGIGIRKPTLSELGSPRWTRTKARVEKALLDFASELLDLQAKRLTLPGIKYSPDTVWQRELEDSFIYEETPDQLKALEEIKRDMESPLPMDRLLCGDVGYGKTELAIRAAFKAVMDGKQVAVLVPTTVLAQQHYRRFSERMAEYPVVVEMLSRFRSDKEQKQILKNLAEGKIDIVIGTHRIIQSDVLFKDLGLVIIDEEQRFGVRHKEFLKKLRCTVDILTMTATPIPRTLYMSLIGIKDMSVIETPPHERLAVQTMVVEYNEEIIRKAILRELNRGGQVYFLHNRVETIEKVASRLQELVPEARFLVVHGRMDEDLLAVVMDEFVDGRADVLVCTTIIQAGLDIPNVNTIIIDRADRFGLADLYQLKGRVGRYKYQAYAYLLIPPRKVLSSVAKRRLRTIEEFSHLGAGFKIAMQDLEIRGAGNILGPQQHGYIYAVGFDLYCKLLKKCIQRLKGEEVSEVFDVKIDIGFTGEIPKYYIEDDKTRIDFYKRIALAINEKELYSILSEMQDRFGSLPKSVKILGDIALLKLRLAKMDIRAVARREDKVYLIDRKGSKTVLHIPDNVDIIKWLIENMYGIIQSSESEI